MGRDQFAVNPNAKNQSLEWARGKTTREEKWAALKSEQRPFTWEITHKLGRSPILDTPQLDLNVSQHTKIPTKLPLQKSCKYIQEVY